MSVKDRLKKIPSKIQAGWIEHKDTIKTSTIIVLATTTTMNYLLLKAISVTRNDYLDKKGLTDDYNEYLTSYEEE